MTILVKVAELDELPPGKGKTVDVGGQEVTVFNEEGRYVATAHLRHLTGPPVETTCSEQPGGHFDATVYDTPARLRIGETRIQVLVRADGVWVIFEDHRVVDSAPCRS